MIAHTPDEVSVASAEVIVKPTPLLIKYLVACAAVTVPRALTATAMTPPVTAAVVAIAPEDPPVKVNVPFRSAAPAPAVNTLPPPEGNVMTPEAIVGVLLSSLYPVVLLHETNPFEVEEPGATAKVLRVGTESV